MCLGFILIVHHDTVISGELKCIVQTHRLEITHGQHTVFIFWPMIYQARNALAPQ